VSLTVTLSAVANAVLRAALWLSPAFLLIEAGEDGLTVNVVWPLIDGLE